MKKLLLLVSVVLLGGAAAWAQAITETDDRYAKETPPTGIEQEYEFKFTPVVDGSAVDVQFYIVPAQANIYSIDGTGKINTANILTSGNDKEFSITMDTGTPGNSSDGFSQTNNIWSKNYTSVPSTGETASIKLTWNPKSVVTETNKYIIVAVATECTNNLAVWEVDPSNNFMIKVENLTASVARSASNLDDDGDGVIDIFEHCPSAVQGVTYDATNGLTYDYGEDVVYVRLEAKHYGTAWTPNANFTGSPASKKTQALPTQSVTTTGITPTVEYIFMNSTEEGSFNPTSATWTAATTGNEIPSDAKPIVYLKYTFDNLSGTNSYEGLTENTIEITATGVDASNNNDVAGDWDGDTTTTPLDVVGADDKVKQQIKARPTVAAN